eukprot:5151605-Pyramimonas_sp.AAC.1
MPCYYDANMLSYGTVCCATGLYHANNDIVCYSMVWYVIVCCDATISIALLLWMLMNATMHATIIASAMICFAKLCYAMLCDALLCNALLCYAMLAMLCHDAWSCRPAA